jgi:hypothetical protein
MTARRRDFYTICILFAVALDLILTLPGPWPPDALTYVLIGAVSLFFAFIWRLAHHD